MYHYVWFAVDVANERTRDAKRQHLLHGEHLAQPSRARRAIARLFGADSTPASGARQFDGYAAK